MKFGGSSLADADRIHHVTELIKNQIGSGYRPRAVICSAMGKTTNALLSAGDYALEGKVNVDAIRTLHTAALDHFEINDSTREEVLSLIQECEDMLNGVKLIQELSPKSLDQLVSYGERCSVRIVAARLNQIGVPAQAFDAWDVGVLTDSNFGDAKLLASSEEDIKNTFQNKINPDVVAVVTGFIGHDPNGKITTLGRGGSDLTATAIGAACQLDEIQVWKDVDGILSADPRLVPNATPVDDVSYDEASELAYFGAQVLHPIAMQPAMKYDVPVRVKNSYNPDAEGTVIKKREGPAPRLVSSIENLHFMMSQKCRKLTQIFMKYFEYTIRSPQSHASETSNFLISNQHKCLGHMDSSQMCSKISKPIVSLLMYLLPRKCLSLSPLTKNKVLNLLKKQWRNFRIILMLK